MAPTDFFRQLKSYYFTNGEELPAISTWTAAALSITYTLLYVLPFYLSSTTRPSPTLSRDAPSVVRARIRFVTLSCIISSFVTIYSISTYARASPPETLRLLGWYPIAPLEIAKALLLTALLFAGPLFEKGVAEGEWREWIRGGKIHESLSSWIGWRNYVAGPVTEEVVFRSLLVPLHLLSHVSPTRTIFMTPLYFGIAHVHHLYEFKLTHPHTAFVPALLRSMFQFTYTTIFGWYATFVFLRTGSLPAVILAHTFCNWCGLPRFWGRVEAGVPIGPPLLVGGGRAKEDRDGKRQNVQVADGRLGVGWTVAYYLILIAGAVAFYRGLWPLTASGRSLADFGEGSRR